MSFKTLVAGIARAGSFFNLTSLDYPTVVDAVKDLEAQLEKAAAAEAAVVALTARVAAIEGLEQLLAGRVAALEKQRDTPSPSLQGFQQPLPLALGGQHGQALQEQAQASLQGISQNIAQGG